MKVAYLCIFIGGAIFAAEQCEKSLSVREGQIAKMRSPLYRIFADGLKVRASSLDVDFAERDSLQGQAKIVEILRGMDAWKDMYFEPKPSLQKIKELYEVYNSLIGIYSSIDWNVDLELSKYVSSELWTMRWITEKSLHRWKQREKEKVITEPFESVVDLFARRRFFNNLTSLERDIFFEEDKGSEDFNRRFYQLQTKYASKEINLGVRGRKFAELILASILNQLSELA